ncbi:MAG: thioredoxin family protein [Verrucomicrobia bacterium]|nr:thioredoxin family protein [Verrucomicrobiota bacterium]
MAEVASTRTLSLGSPSPIFTLPDAAGHPFSLNDVRGPKGLVVAFLCNHCPFVIHLATALADFADTCLAKGVGFVGINSNDVTRYPADNPEKMREMQRTYHWSFPYLHDESQAVARSYFAACTPDFYLFDENLKLTYCGQFDDSRPNNGKPVTGDSLRSAVTAMLAQLPPISPQRPSSGCSIKWKPGIEVPPFRG